ncbi:MAG: methyltransferase domain-containing protein [Nitrospinae bacterium]|nr:methyltransferase domain-containing protein [Nitrospinota bacterium]
MKADSIKKIYGTYSGIYDIIFKQFFFPRQKHAIQNINIAENETVLDVGVGTGYILNHYPKNAKVVGIDLTYGMLKEAQKRKKNYKLDNINLLEMNAEHMAFADDSFNHVVGAFVISVVPDPVKVLMEMKRVCKRDGNIVLVNHFKSQHPVIGKIEKMINPFCCKIGWKSDLVLEHLVKEADLKIVEKYTWKKIDLWNIVLAENNKPF